MLRITTNKLFFFLTKTSQKHGDNIKQTDSLIKFCKKKEKKLMVDDRHIHNNNNFNNDIFNNNNMCALYLNYCIRRYLEVQ